MASLCSCGSKEDKSESTEISTSSSKNDSKGAKDSKDSKDDQDDKDDKDDDSPPGGPVSVVVQTIAKETVPIYGEWVGRTDASETVDVRARVEGFLESANFKEGDFVSKGQVLFTIEKKKYEAEVLSAQANLDKAKAALIQAQTQVEVKKQQAEQQKFLSNMNRAKQDLARVQALTKEGALSAHDLDVANDAYNQAKAQYEAQNAQVSDSSLNQRSAIATAQANVNSAEAALAEAKLNLSYCTVRSPLHGIIGKIQVFPGSLVGRVGDKTVLATVSSVDPIKVDFSIAEADYLRYTNDTKSKKPNQNADRFQLLTADNKVYEYKGKFKTLDRAMNAQTGTIDAQCTFPNPKAVLRPGQFGRIRAVITSMSDTLLVPQKAVQEMQGIKVVFTVDDQNKVVQHTVETGDSYKDFFVVKSGLKAGDRVIVEGTMKARPGQVVSVASK